MSSDAENLLVPRIRAIYDEGAPRQILPHIGGAFLAPTEDSLRILAVGINSYLDAPADASPILAGSQDGSPSSGIASRGGSGAI